MTFDLGKHRSPAQTWLPQAGVSVETPGALAAPGLLATLPSGSGIFSVLGPAEMLSPEQNLWKPFQLF